MDSNQKLEFLQRTENLLKSEAGQNLLVELHGLFNNGILIGNDPNETYFNLGARSVVLYLDALASGDEARRLEREKDNPPLGDEYE